MSRRLIAIFTDELDLLGATRACRKAGFRIEDAFTPFAVHGLDEAMGLRPSRLTWVAFLAGLSGFGLMLYFEGWTSAVDWPLVIGGKAPLALPAFIPVAFEAMVLTAGLVTVAALFWRARLRPGKVPKLIDPRVTDDRFALVLIEYDAAFDHEGVSAIFEQHNVESTRWESINGQEDVR